MRPYFLIPNSSSTDFLHLLYLIVPKLLTNERSSVPILLSSALVSIVFGIMMPLYGYNTALDIQPATVGEGFRIFMTIPSIIGSLLAVVALWFYPLHGKRLQEVKEALKRLLKNNQPHKKADL